MQRTAVLVSLAKGQVQSHNCSWKGIFRLLSLVQHKEVWESPLGGLRSSLGSYIVWVGSGTALLMAHL